MGRTALQTLGHVAKGRPFNCNASAVELVKEHMSTRASSCTSFLISGIKIPDSDIGVAIGKLVSHNVLYHYERCRINIGNRETSILSFFPCKPYQRVFVR